MPKNKSNKPNHQRAKSAQANRSKVVGGSEFKRAVVHRTAAESQRIRQAVENERLAREALIRDRYQQRVVPAPLKRPVRLETLRKKPVPQTRKSTYVKRAATLRSRPSRQQLKSPVAPSGWISVGDAPQNARLRFEDPRKAWTCVKRAMRREVLLALGKGGAHHSRKSRTEDSNIGC